jgi:hypothetical protein
MVLAWAAIVGMSGLIVVNTVPYYSLGDDFAFLVEKGALAFDPVWRACFYLHITGGMICLVTGPVLLWTRKAHRWLGRAYGLAVLGFAGPASLVMSIFSKGGPSCQACFLMLAALWWGATAKAIHEIKNRRVEEHRTWMLRSYALALSAVFFRIFQLAFFAGGMEDEPNYVVSLWLSLAASVAFGEALVARGVHA